MLRRMAQALQLGGAVLILVAFAGLQRGSMKPGDVSYLALNLVGGAILTAAAIIDFDWGFLLLEVVWTIVSAWSLLGLARGRSPGPSH
jgi:hypothetical protein